MALSVSLQDIHEAVSAAAEADWQPGETPLLHLSTEDRRRRLGAVTDPARLAAARAEPAFRAARAALPVRVDWRERGVLTGVRDQGNCGSCVSFACVAVLEAMVRITRRRTVNLSEADLHFCSAHGATCDGWWPDEAFAETHRRGVCAESLFPYRRAFPGGAPHCRVDPQRGSRTLRSSAPRALTDATAVKQWLGTQGPVAACFDVYEDFYSYTHGVYRHVTGAYEGGHCVALVGYDDTRRCWIAKNSWGTGWGERGYFRIAYGQCAIDDNPAYGVAGIDHLWPGGGRLAVFDFREGPVVDGVRLAATRYREDWGDSPVLDGWHDAGDAQRVGDFLGLGYDQVLFVNRGGSGGRTMIADLRDGTPPVEVRHREDWGGPASLNGWDGPEDLQLAGDFLQLGRDQLLCVNRQPRRPGTGRVTVLDFREGPVVDGVRLAATRYREDWGDSPVLNGWHDGDDAQLAGDFLGLGYDQVLFVNRGGSGGRTMIADLRDGTPPVEVRHREDWGGPATLDGWDGPADVMLAGDFLQLGRAQLLCFARSPARTGGRVAVFDFREGPVVDGVRLAATRYREDWGDSHVLDGWLNPGDVQVAGDFLGLGYDQVLFVNRGGTGGRTMIADLRDGTPPVEVRHREDWGGPATLDGWDDPVDVKLAGDFAGLGRDQLACINRGPF